MSGGTNGYSGKFCDACVFHEWPSSRTLAPYLAPGWADVLDRPKIRVLSSRLYRDLRSANAAQSPNADALVSELLGEGSNRELAVLGYSDGLFSTVLPNYYVARAVAQAANDWTTAEWLPRDDRLHALIIVSTALPESAAAEIRRVGEKERFVGVALGGNALGLPFGHPVYHPIYEAAADLGLPVVLQAGPSDAFGDAAMSPVAGGNASTVAEFRALSWHSHMVHLSSMIIGGVFNTFPKLKLILVGGGMVWVTGQLLRLDYWFRMVTYEARWLDRLPSEYFEDHIRLSTVGMEKPPQSELLEQVLSTIPGIERALVYGSGYPDSGWEEPNAVAARLPTAWHERVFFENALESFRWPARVTDPGFETARGVAA